MPSVYLETTIPSYLTAWRSPELVMAARQQITREWWDTRRHDFELFVSQLVIDEASAGDAEAASRRLAILEGIPILEAQADTDVLVEALVRDLSLPDRAAADAVHIALSVVNGMDYLLTWNCTHIANAAFRPGIEAACRLSSPSDLHARRTSGGVTMKLDPVLAEIRAAREAYAERFAGDVKAMLEDIRRRQQQGGRKVVARPPKRLVVPKEPLPARR